MMFRRTCLYILIGGLAACGGGGEDGSNPLDGGVDDGNKAGFSEENFVVAANSLEILEQPMALNNFVISILHHLDAKSGTTVDECLFNSSGTGDYQAVLNEDALEINLTSCDIEGLGQVTGTISVAFSSLEKANNYLTFNAILNAPQLSYSYEGQAFSLGFDASISQSLISSHQIKQSLSLIGNEAISFNDVPFYFKDSNLTKQLDYTTGDYSLTFSARFSLPSAFEGEMDLSTSHPIAGKINHYPESGRFVVSGGFGDFIAISPYHLDASMAEVELQVSGQNETVEVMWQDVMSGSAVAFPARQGIDTGEWGNPGFTGDAGHWHYENQSPKVHYPNGNSLQPTVRFLVMPAPAAEDLNNVEIFNSYESDLVPNEHYQISADGPWVTIDFINNLPVDRSFMTTLYAEDGNHFVSYSFNTNKAFDVIVTTDQFISVDQDFILSPTSSSHPDTDYSIDWTLIDGDKDITVTRLDSTRAQITPSEMTEGRNYTFLASITDPYSRVSTQTVTLSTEPSNGERSYLELILGPNYYTSPSQTLLFLSESSGSISEELLSIQGEQNNLWFSVNPFIDGAANSRENGANIHLSVGGQSWTYHCYDKSIQVSVLENETVDLGINEEGQLAQYQKLALDFELECDGAYLSGKLRNRSSM